MGHGGHLDLGAGIGPSLLRFLLLAAVPVVVGFVLLRGFVGEPSRLAAVSVMGAAATAVGMNLLLSGGLNMPQQLVPLLLAALALPMYLVQSRDERFAAAVGRARVLAPVVFLVLAVPAAIQLGLGWLGGAAPDRTATVLHTGVLLGLVAMVWFVVARPRGRLSTAATRVGATVLALGLLAGSAQAVTLNAPEPVPGGATAASLDVGRSVDVVVVPNLPGWNLVHVGSPTASVGTRKDDLTPARPRAGTSGGWVAVKLPAGRSDVWVRDGDGLDSVATDTGGAGAAPRELIGADGPECASALLGRTLAAGTASGVRCPSERLSPLDSTTLRETVDSLAGHGHRRIAVAGDRSPRGLAAMTAVRSAAADRGVEVVAPGVAGTPLLLTSGWTTAAAVLDRVRDGDVAADGTYLAPWLLTEPLLAQRAGQADEHVGLRFDPSAEPFRRYRAELRDDYPGQAASAAGYREWLAGRPGSDDGSDSGAVRLYATSRARSAGLEAASNR